MILKLYRCDVFLVIIPKPLLSLSTTMQYVIYTYMKHLGVRVKEPRSLESKRVRINFLRIKVLYMHTSPGDFLFLFITCLTLCLPFFVIKHRKA